MINIALVDSRVRHRAALAEYIRSFDEYDVMLEASDGQDFIRQVRPDYHPDMVIMDTSTPRTLGQDTARWISNHYPQVKIFAFSISAKARSIVRTHRISIRRYAFRDRDPLALRPALGDLLDKGFYYSDMLSGRMLPGSSIREERIINNHALSERELQFLRLACSELTYKEIADKMYLSARTIDGYRDALFDKLNVRTRVGLVMYAIRSGIAAA
ncbi:response regulator transcription factor [Dinghuibacter silviterrae]|uniref:DNA-binding NarL/FixJ family response regulator n=1 Tax=Dinghuibacter silviterrae TaxID=1539049 RepID=A0A4R8DU35_9BACT|nr:response regulator transcription factor [Dinghuibacter silviterrae]TDX01862.1 DNA-binding NarL/FixJ family response regulator [Dinghuibacter silviterrae]